MTSEREGRSPRPFQTAAPEVDPAPAGLATMGRRAFAHTLAGAAVFALAGCKIVPATKKEAGRVEGFDGVRHVAGIWDTRVLPHVRDHAAPLVSVVETAATGLDTAGSKFGHRPGTEGAPWNFVVAGEGVVKTKNTESRAGTLAVEIAGTAGPIEVTIQIGPVIKGNSVRDAMPFLSFQDFTNQIDFAQVGRAMNDRAAAGVAPTVAAVAVGDRIRFAGTMTLLTAADRLLVTPIEISRIGSQP